MKTRYHHSAFRTLVAAAALTLASLSNASPAMLNMRVQGAVNGLSQTCPAAFPEASCYWVSGDVISTARIIEQKLPGLLSNLWRDGPEQGLSTEIPAEHSVIHLIPRGSGQVLVIVQSSSASVVGSSASAVPSLGASHADLSPAAAAVTDQNSLASEFIVTNPMNYYFVVLDSRDQPVLQLSSLKSGTYRLVVSDYARATVSQTITVPPAGLKTLVLPTLESITPSTTLGSIGLPVTPGYFFLIQNAKGEVTLDASALKEGAYSVLSYRFDGTPGPHVRVESIRMGLPTLVFHRDFNAAFAGVPADLLPVPSPSLPIYTAPAPATSNSGQCWVNGYTRSNGTRVSGYYRRC